MILDARATTPVALLELANAAAVGLDKLDPKILIGERFGLWPQDQEVVNVRTLADYFTQLTHLPRLHGPQVLPDCLAKGMQRGLFGYALGDGEHSRELHIALLLKLLGPEVTLAQVAARLRCSRCGLRGARLEARYRGPTGDGR